ncbi:MAG: hypothetical protein AB1Z98_11675 [Nannocystaceae bacterium]
MPRPFRSPLPCSTFALLLLACGSASGGATSQGTEGTAGSTGPDLSPSVACDAYLECATIVTPAGLGPLLDAYGPEGTCWQSTPAVAEQCEMACEAGLELLQMSFPDEAACAEQADGGSGDGSGGTVTERAVDIIFVVDNSGTMGDEQAVLVQSIEGLLSTLDAAVPPVDYRIAVTTTDDGNPWCQVSGPQAGEFRATSCRSRESEFVFMGAQTIEAYEVACAAGCSIDDLGLPEPWVDVVNSMGSSNVPGDQVAETLRCMLPQGINGCGFEQPLESTWKAVRRTQTNTDPAFAFRRPGSLLAVMVVTDEADCSSNDDWDTIFEDTGNRVFWSDPESPAPSSAVCWNAGVACQGGGGGSYDSCTATNFDVNANQTTDADAAVLYPLDRYTSILLEESAFIMAINGVNSDGSITYADTLSDPQFQTDFGIGPGCSSTAGDAIPPVRVHQVIEAVSGPGNERSICDEDYTDSMAAFGSGILSRLPG